MYNLRYIIKENGYEIYKDNKLWITQYEPYIPNPSLSYEENAINHIDELNTISMSDDTENRISILTEENEKLKQELALTQDAVNEILFMMMNMEGK